MDHLALLEGEVVAMAAALAAADPARTIPSCPGWTTADLSAHLTAVHRWALGALRNEGPPPYDEKPADAAAYSEAATALVTRLAELPPDAPCWTFNKRDSTAGFWRRRQLQEVSIHRWDLEEHPIELGIAADGISEVVDFFLPRQIGTGRATLPDGTLTLDNGTQSWTLVSGTGPTATVRGSTLDLDLLLWGRRALSDVETDGDQAFAAAVFAAALTP
jgi:uncharacterized protein (TIGR03083 family)